MASERKVVKAGYLIKSPPQEKLMAQWHRRYFILWSTKLMEYYSSHEHKPQDYLKTVDLSKCEDMVAPLPITNRPHTIKLSVRVGGKLRDYFLDCGSEGEMAVWVKCFAKVCGFSPVDEDEGDSDNYDLCSSPSYPEDDDQPLYDDISDNPTNRNSAAPKRPQLRLPTPPPKLKGVLPQDSLDNATYEEPLFELDNNYHVLEENDSPSGTLERDLESSLTDQWYDDVGVNDAVVYSMNKHPPPVWRPEIDDGVQNPPPPLPPNRRERSSEPEEQLRRVLESESSPVRKPRLPKAVHLTPSRSKPLPPPKPKPDSASDISFCPKSVPGGGIFNFKDDPKFRSKLQEKRQELYGDTNDSSRGRSLSMGEGEEFYESVLFTVDDSSDLPPKLPPKTDTMKRESSGLPKRPITPQHTTSRNATLAHLLQRSPPHSKSHEHIIQPSGASTPPPLPSRELVDPSLPPYGTFGLSPARSHLSNASTYRGSLDSATYEEPKNPLDSEEPPPVPVRLTSNRPSPSSELLSGHERRRNSLPSPTPVPTRDYRKQLPLPDAHSSELLCESRLFTQTLAGVLSSSSSDSTPVQPPRPPAPVPPLERKESEVYDDVGSPSQLNSTAEVVYEDIEPGPLVLSRSLDDLSFSASYDDVIPATRPQQTHNPTRPQPKATGHTQAQRNAVLPNRGQQRRAISPHTQGNSLLPRGQRAMSPQAQGNSLLPVARTQQRDTSPQAQSVNTRQVPKSSQVSGGPPLPPNKPKSTEPVAPPRTQRPPIEPRGPNTQRPAIEPRGPSTQRPAIEPRGPNTQRPIEPRGPKPTMEPIAPRGPNTQRTSPRGPNMQRLMKYKPPVTKKPPVPVLKPPVISRKPPPPTRPKPSAKGDPNNIDSPTRKPLLPKKPLIPSLS